MYIAFSKGRENQDESQKEEIALHVVYEMRTILSNFMVVVGAHRFVVLCSSNFN